MNKYAEFSKPRPLMANRRCLTKADYRTEDKAELMAAHIFSVLGERQIPYHCPMCFRWHLTSKVQSFHDDKFDGRPDMHVSTQHGDLDCVGRELRPGS